MLTPILETKRTTLRPLMLSDAEEAFNNWTSDPEVAKYTCWSTHESIEATKEWLTFVENEAGGKNYYDWGIVLKESGELIGSCGVSYNEKEKTYEIGYVIMRKHWNKGFASEAAKAITDFSFKKLKAASLFSRHAKENIYSANILDSIGFVYRNEGKYTSFDGMRTYESFEYILRSPNKTVRK